MKKDIWFRCKSKDDDLFCLNNVKIYNMWKYDNSEDNEYLIKTKEEKISYKDKKTRDEDFEKISKLIATNRNNIFNKIELFINKYCNIILSIILVYIIDKIFLDGIIIKKVKGAIENSKNYLSKEEMNNE